MRVSPGKNIERYTRMICGAAAFLLLFPQSAGAVGTAAGMVISNVATVSYGLGGVAQPAITSAAATIRIDELIQPTLTWQDGTPVIVNSPGTNSALTFLLTNSGNGQESFSLVRVNGPAPLPAGNYTPLNGTVGSVYLENGLLAGFQSSGPNADTVYVPGVNDPTLAADAGQFIYVVSDTPLVVPNSRGDVQLQAASLTAGAAGAAPGTGLANAGQGGGFAVVGGGRAQASATGSYLSNGLGFAMSKTVTAVVDPGGTAVLMPGAVMTYQILATLTGAGTANNLVITDPLPVEVTYVPGSIAVDGVAKTDAADADNAEFISATRTVSVSLGSVAAPASIVITLRATIN